MKDSMVYTVWRSDDQTTHIFSTREKAQKYADTHTCGCVLSEYMIDNPERFYGVTQ